MYLSIVQPDLSRVNVARALMNEQDMHRNIQALFDSDRASNHVLYRTIPSKDIRRTVICVQSDVEPRSTVDLKVISCTSAQNRILNLRAGMDVEYDVLLRPVKRHEGKSCLIHEKEARAEWVRALGKKYGFTIITIQEQARIQKTIAHAGTKSGRIDGWRYVGILCVDDLDVFVKAYQTGIGRDKSYGYGMLMLKLKE